MVAAKVVVLYANAFLLIFKDCMILLPNRTSFLTLPDNHLLTYDCHECRFREEKACNSRKCVKTYTIDSDDLFVCLFQEVFFWDLSRFGINHLFFHITLIFIKIDNNDDI